MVGSLNCQHQVTEEVLGASCGIPYMVLVLHNLRMVKSNWSRFSEGLLG